HSEVAHKGRRAVSGDGGKRRGDRQHPEGLGRRGHRLSTVMEGARAHPAYEVAVVGHRGFLGSHIAAAFEREGVSWRGFGSDDPVAMEGEAHPDLQGVRTLVWCAGRANPRLA